MRCLSRFLNPSPRLTIASIPSPRPQPAPSPSPPPYPPSLPPRFFHTTPSPSAPIKSKPPRTHDRGPASTEDTQTDFSALDVLRNTVAPATSIDACTADGFALNNQMRITGSGILLVGGEAFRWWPWRYPNYTTPADRISGTLLNAQGQWEPQNEAWGVLELVYPKPDLLIIGTGKGVVPLAPRARTYLNGLGVRLEVLDTRNAAAQFNLLATERGVGQVAGALVPVGWWEGRG